MNNEVKVSDMDKFDENIEKLTSILNNSRTTKSTFSSVELKDDKKTLTESLEHLENKLFYEYNRILMFGTDEEKEEFLNWEEMDDTEKKAFAKALGSRIAAITCDYFDEHTINRSQWKEMARMVVKEIVLQMETLQKISLN